MPHSSADMAYGVSNSFKRGLGRTYSRRSARAALLDDDGPPRKLIRMDSSGFVQIETNMSRATTKPSTSLANLNTAAASSSTAHDIITDSNPSTPVRESIFSDPSHQASSPLSSPPAVSRPYKPAFNLLKRKRSSSGAGSGDRDTSSTAAAAAGTCTAAGVVEGSRPGTPLTEITGNDRHSNTHTPSSTNASASQTSSNQTSTNSAPPPSKKTKLTQLTLDLGQDARRTCKGCGMAYVSSSPEDAALHRAFHATNIGGVDVGGRALAKEARVVGHGAGDGEVVVVVDRKSAAPLRRKAEKVLDVVRQDLGAVEIESERLWGSMLCPVSGRKFGKALARAKEKGEEEEPREDCFKAFLFLDRDKCVGFCLAERISRGLRVAESSSSASVVGVGAGVEANRSGKEQTATAGNRHAAGIKSSSVSTERTTDTVLLGVSRVWTSRSHRRKGIASALLDCARTNFFYGIEIPKDMVAFSQPTESGGQLAQRWYGQEAGWHVYEC